MPDVTKPKNPSAAHLYEMASMDLSDACKVPWEDWQDALGEAVELIATMEEGERRRIKALVARVARAEGWSYDSENTMGISEYTMGITVRRTPAPRQTDFSGYRTFDQAEDRFRKD